MDPKTFICYRKIAYGTIWEATAVAKMARDRHPCDIVAYECPLPRVAEAEQHYHIGHNAPCKNRRAS